MSLILYSFARKKVCVAECFRVGAFAMMLIWIAPLFDYFVSGAFEMFYPRDPLNVVLNLHHWADPAYDYEGVSLGMRVEILLAGLGGMVYLWYKTRRVVLSFLGGLCLLLTCLTIGLLIPFVTQYYEYGFHFGYHPLYDSVLLHQGFVVHGTPCKIALFYLLVNLFVFSLAYYLRNPKYFKAIVRNFRWTRSIHYLILYLTGVMFIYHHPPFADSSCVEDFDYLATIWNHPIDLLGIFMASLSVFLSFQSAVIFNDIHDFEIDEVSNSHRPLVTKAIPFSEFKMVGKLFVILSLVIAFCINETFFFFMLLYHLLAFLYSTPPFRLRQYFIVSNIELASIFLLTFHAGTTVLIPNYAFQHVYPSVTFGLIITYSLALTIKDLKDFDGDKKSQVQTLPTLFGKKVGAMITVSFVCCAILLSPAFMHLMHLMVFCVFVCAVFLLLVMSKINLRVKEYLVTLLYFIYVVVLFYHIVFSDNLH